MATAPPKAFPEGEGGPARAGSDEGHVAHGIGRALRYYLRPHPRCRHPPKPHLRLPQPEEITQLPLPRLIRNAVCVIQAILPYIQVVPRIPQGPLPLIAHSVAFPDATVSQEVAGGVLRVGTGQVLEGLVLDVCAVTIRPLLERLTLRCGQEVERSAVLVQEIGPSVVENFHDGVARVMDLDLILPVQIVEAAGV